MKYFVNQKERTEEVFYNRLKFENELECEGIADDCINASYPAYEIDGKRYAAADVLKAVDHKAYKLKRKDIIAEFYGGIIFSLLQHGSVTVNKIPFEIKKQEVEV